jgi:hypothetical protein
MHLSFAASAEETFILRRSGLLIGTISLRYQMAPCALRPVVDRLISIADGMKAWTIAALRPAICKRAV